MDPYEELSERSKALGTYARNAYESGQTELCQEYLTELYQLLDSWFDSKAYILSKERSS